MIAPRFPREHADRPSRGGRRASPLAWPRASVLLGAWLLLGGVLVSPTACTTETITTVPAEDPEEQDPDDGGESDEPSPSDDDDDDDDDGDRDDDVAIGDEVHGLPDGQLPHPGGCRIWNPEVSPGKQSSPGDCEELRRLLPPGHWLLYRPTDAKRVYRIA